MSIEAQLKWLCLNGYFLRDDYHIRVGNASFTGREHAWSLFLASDKDGYMQRIAVYSGSYEKAVEYCYGEAKSHQAQSLGVTT